MDKNLEVQSGYGKKTRFVAHEIKNQLSICELYSQIIRKYCQNNDICFETIENALDSINKSVQIANNHLISLKSVDGSKLEPFRVNELLQEAVSLAKVYTEGKPIELLFENNVEQEILADKNKLVSVLINLVKNAVEAHLSEIELEEERERFVKVSTKVEDMFVKITVENNGKPIADSGKVFEEGFTTKATGSGLGLVICKQDIEEQFGQLRLVKSDDSSTEFEISMSVV